MIKLLLLVATVLLLTPSVVAQEALDVTLIIGADVELGMEGRGMTDQIARNHALAMRNLVDTNGQRLRWPRGTSPAGAEIGLPSGIFIAGDLARDNSLGEYGKLLEELYLGPDPAAGAPGYLGWGNHDIYAHDWWFTPQGAGNSSRGIELIEKQGQDVVSRFQQYFGLWGATPPHYAVRKGRLLVVQLNTSLGEPCRRSTMIPLPNFFGLGDYADSSDATCAAQQWLRKTLDAHKALHGERAPALVVQHYGYDVFGVGGGGYRGYWWHPDTRRDFANILDGVNVIGFFHGHTHRDLFTPKGTTIDNQPVFGRPESDLTSPTLDVGYVSGGRAWADFDGDGKLAFCRVTDRNGEGGRVRCRLYDGTGFATADVVSPELDAGWSEGRAWTDVNGDGKADFCRVTARDQQTIRCTLSEGTSFGNEIEARLDVGGVASGRTWADFDGDGRSDYCRVDSDYGTGKVRCALSTGSGFGKDVVSGPLDVGYREGRAFVDVNDDRRADYCRVVDRNDRQGKIRCTLSTGSGFAGDLEASLDVGYFEGRTWADVNGDRKADYCRVTDANQALGVIRCRLSTGTSFAAQEVTSRTAHPRQEGLDVGVHAGRTWADFDADGRADYCRVVLDDRAECSMSDGSSFQFGESIRSLRLADAGYARSRVWADINGDGRTDFCRVIDSEEEQGRVRCTYGTVASTVVPVDSYGVASGYCPNRGYVGGFTVIRVTDTRLDVVPVRKTAALCGDPRYDGSVTVNHGLVRSVPIVTR